MPQNEGFMIAAYVVAGVIYALYSVSLFVRARRTLRGSD